jgi:DNA-binding CsgD family transcriptional regulator
MARVAAGRSNKEIARELDISHRTVEVHRARVLEKTNARSAVELAAMAKICGLDTDFPPKRSDV